MAKAKKEEEDEVEDEKVKYSTASPEDLLLDAKNPRLVEFAHTSNPTQFDLLRTLWQKMAVDELAMSMAANGFFPHEPLFVAEEDDKQVVIEGNRRLAALKLLRDSGLRKRLKITDLPELTDKKRKELDKIPIVITTRKDLWQYIGFKHVNGPAKWGSYAKAQYIAFVKDNYKVSLEKIAEQIGDKNRTVQRLYRAMMVIQQAEEEEVFKREHRYKGSFAFSHLYTGLDYDGFRRFLKLSDETAESKKPVPKDRIKELGELCKWLYGDNRGEATKPLIQSQNPDLSLLDEILQKDASIDALRSGMTLALAHDVSLGEDRVFRESLQQAKQYLSRASGTLSAGFKKEDTDLLRTARTIADQADDLVAQMERKALPEKKRRRAGDADDV